MLEKHVRHRNDLGYDRRVFRWRSLPTTVAFLGCGLAFGCRRREHRPITPAPTLTASVVAAVPAPSVPAAQPVIASASASAVPAASITSYSDPPWPPARPGSTLKLTWVVYPVRENSPNPEWEPRQVELVARIGAVARRIALKGGPGMLNASFQNMCTPPAKREKNLVAGLVLEHAGFNELRVYRDPPHTLTITSQSSMDGLCTDAHEKAIPCPVSSTTLAVIPIPDDVAIREAIVDVTGPGKEEPLECYGGQ